MDGQQRDAGERERPTVTPIGNLHDLVADVCMPTPDAGPFAELIDHAANCAECSEVAAALENAADFAGGCAEGRALYERWIHVFALEVR